MISYDLLSNVGDRENNEDNVGMYQNGQEYCFVLADGLGGHGKGEEASRLAVEAAVKVFAAAGAGENEMDQSFAQAQQAILEGQKADYHAQDMKTTLVVLHVGNQKIWWGHIGDSRLYYFKNGKLVQRTLDHSVPQMLVAAGQIKEKQIRNHPDRNRLLRVLGTEWDTPKYQIAEPIERESSQAFLLCTDGFWELIDEKKMQHFLKKAKTPADWLSLMEGIVKKNGHGKNMDNYSAVAVWLAD
ncbi:MAG: protein phosphatase 2C domain-containing protein [Lachnospiraceae bacterium]|nr:protein phosphatase 2C domain-containing protein [Lachnospiraceae bacterium]MDO5549688.1 protein phosphatase 2C domain-containing protein [Lachnospiraceae bacterium]